MREIAQIFVCFSEKPNFNVFHLLPFQFIHISATEKSCPLSTCFKFDTQIEMNWNQQGWNTSNYDCNNELSQFVIIVFFINMIKISIMDSYPVQVLCQWLWSPGQAVETKPILPVFNWPMSTKPSSRTWPWSTFSYSSC